MFVVERVIAAPALGFGKVLVPGGGDMKQAGALHSRRRRANPRCRSQARLPWADMKQVVGLDGSCNRFKGLPEVEREREAATTAGTVRSSR